MAFNFKSFSKSFWIGMRLKKWPLQKSSSHISLIEWVTNVKGDYQIQLINALDCHFS
jgi:hypothetical protein